MKLFVGQSDDERRSTRVVGRHSGRASTSAPPSTRRGSIDVPRIARTDEPEPRAPPLGEHGPTSSMKLLHDEHDDEGTPVCKLPRMVVGRHSGRASSSAPPSTRRGSLQPCGRLANAGRSSPDVHAALPTVLDDTEDEDLIDGMVGGPLCAEDDAPRPSSKSADSHAPPLGEHGPTSSMKLLHDEHDDDGTPVCKLPRMVVGRHSGRASTSAPPSTRRGSLQPCGRLASAGRSSPDIHAALPTVLDDTEDEDLIDGVGGAGALRAEDDAPRRSSCGCDDAFLQHV
eukprot:55999-Prymnesium_polylepis.2